MKQTILIALLAIGIMGCCDDDEINNREEIVIYVLGKIECLGGYTYTLKDNCNNIQTFSPSLFMIKDSIIK